MFRLFASHPDLCRDCLKVVVAAPSFQLSSLVLLGVLLTHLFKSQEELSVEYVDVLKLFAVSVLGSRTRPDYMVVGNCAGIFKKVTRQQFEELLLPSMLKALRRNPDELMKSE